jgi:hypothetical protein
MVSCGVGIGSDFFQTCLHREGDVEQRRLGPGPADELEPDGEPALVMPDLMTNPSPMIFKTIRDLNEFPETDGGPSFDRLP